MIIKKEAFGIPKASFLFFDKKMCYFKKAKTTLLFNLLPSSVELSYFGSAAPDPSKNILFNEIPFDAKYL